MVFLEAQLCTFVLLEWKKCCSELIVFFFFLNCLAVMISVLQFYTDAQTLVRAHTNTDAESDEMMEERGETGVEEK